METNRNKNYLANIQRTANICDETWDDNSFGFSKLNWPAPALPKKTAVCVFSSRKSGAAAANTDEVGHLVGDVF